MPPPQKIDAETPLRGSWADPHGPGRCARCACWLTEGACKVTATPRNSADTRASTYLCWDCTREVFKAWWAWVPTSGEDVRYDAC